MMASEARSPTLTSSAVRIFVPTGAQLFSTVASVARAPAARTAAESVATS
jgi:hypothetical protein